MNDVSKSFQTRDKFIVPAGSLTYIPLALAYFIHIHALHKHHTAYNTLGTAPNIGYVGICHKAVF